MAVANNKTHCFTCNKEKITYPCRGCSKEFCLTHLTEHQQMLNEELNHIINDYDEFKQRINEQKQNPQNHSLIKQIDQWERKSIEIIQQKAQDCRENLVKSSQTYVNDIEKKFNDLCEQIKQIHAENEFNEINLNDLRNQLNKITEELNNSSNISIHQESQSFINEISIISSKKPKFNKWKQTANTVAAGNGQGQQLNQLNHPAGIFIDKNKNIFIADRDNHRIVEWKYNANEGQTIAGENKQGNRMHQLGRPTDVIVDEQNHSIVIADLGNRRVIQWMNQNQDVLVDSINCQGLAMNKNEFLYVSDSQRNEVIRWKMGDNEAIVVAGGNGQGNQRNQLDFPTFIFVDKDQAVYVSDFNNHRVMKWRKGAKKGKIVAGGNGEGRNLNQLCHSGGVVVDDLGQIYVADFGNHRVMRWCEGKKEGEIVVGGNGEGSQSSQLYGPCGLSFDDEGNLYVADCKNHRIQKFEIFL
ncbi:unnamed protein product [Adineta steineri]|uniref:Uncharacterized protein n=1 Tax=Adineta steineri TaxID=433720 RepID=A0A815C9M2_9BILA|nr:unnamed protein product [Adineta steineri]CAF1461484.1 unnamed protein product [Adineta steineri]